MLGEQPIPKASGGSVAAGRRTFLRGNPMLTLIPVLLSVSLAADPKLEPPLPEGHRAYAVKFEPATQIDGFIQPGIKVDVVLTEREKEGKAKSSVVLKDVLVVVVDMTEKGKVLTA